MDRSHRPPASGGLQTSPSVVLLDVGDTMVRPDPSWRDVYATVFDHYSIEATAAEFEAAFRAAWVDWEDEGPFEATETASFQRLMQLDQHVFDRLGHPDLPEAFFHDVDRAFRQRSAFHVFPDVIPALDALQAAGFRLGIVSNWGWAAPELLQNLELARHFEVLAISAHVGYQKPHPAIFEHALELLEVGPSEAIHVGDDVEADLVGARRAGIEPILIDRRHRPRSDRAGDGPGHEALVISDLGDLLELLGMARPSTPAASGTAG